MKKQFAGLAAYCRRLKLPLIIVTALFLLLTVGGTAFFYVLHEKAEAVVAYFMQSVSGGILDESGGISLLGLLLNNLRACAVAILFGLVPFFFLPAVAIIINAGIIGAVLGYATYSGASLWRLVVFGLLPHGIFELPALLLGFASGVSLCLTVTRCLTRLDGAGIAAELKNAARLYIMAIVPLLIIAALTETYITPLLIQYAV